MADISQYKYVNMSNLVLQHDKRFSTRRTDEATGDPESLAGRINIRDMGSIDARENAPRPNKKTADLKDKERGDIREGEDVLEREQRKRKRGEPQRIRGAGILSEADALVEGLKYRPRTSATRHIYDLILTITTNHLGDVPHEVGRSAADAILEYLKDENMKDYDKKKEVDDLLGVTMGPKEFNELVNLSKKITDYDQEDEAQADGADAGAEEAELDERQGVAVDFDDEEDGDEDRAQTYEVRDEDESSDDDDGDEVIGERAVTNGNKDEALEDPAEGEEMVIDGDIGANAATQGRKSAKEILARDIDTGFSDRLVLSTLMPMTSNRKRSRQCGSCLVERLKVKTCL